MCTCSCVCWYMCTHTCGGQSLRLHVFLYCSPPYHMKQGLLQNLELMILANPASLRSNCPHSLSPCPVTTGSFLLCPSFTYVRGIQTQVFMLACQALDSLSHLPSSDHFFLTLKQNCYCTLLIIDNSLVLYLDDWGDETKEEDSLVFWLGASLERKIWRHISDKLVCQEAAWRNKSLG